MPLSGNISKGIKFDLILYTPPITFNRVIKAAKANANPEVISYMILKDIFPQNAVDLGVMSMSGLKGYFTECSDARRWKFTASLTLSGG